MADVCDLVFGGGANSASWLSALRSGTSAPALVDADKNVTCSYARLQSMVRAAAERLGGNPRHLIFLFAANDIASVVCYLAALEAGHAVFLSPVGVSHAGAASLIQRYRPEIVVWGAGELAPAVAGDYGNPEAIAGCRSARRLEVRDPAPHDAIGVVLSTSGSSGSSKAVRLPAAGLGVTAAAVAEALRLHSGERVLASLPFGYVYGLSVLNSALHCGATLVLLAGSPADKCFWQAAARAGVTMIPAVSQTLDLMRRHGVDPDMIPTLAKVTHSGDSLDPQLFSWVHERLGRRGVQLYLMYGQTEAGGRMTVLQPEHLPHSHRSVGTALGACEIRIDAGGEILFRGPGVMLGYAHGREDLSRAGRTGGWLRTGDLGYLDANGFLHVCGRLTRDRKIFGKRINLDEVESFVRAGVPVAAVERDGVISIFFETGVPPDAPSVLVLSRHFQLPPQAFRLLGIARLPCTVRGKIAYEALTQLAQAQPSGPREPRHPPTHRAVRE